MKKAVIPDPPETSGEDVLQNQPQKIFPLQGAGAFLISTAFDVTEGHLPIPAAEDIFLGDHYSGPMPRIARIVAPGYPHHVTQRGNNRTTIFFEDEDRENYLNLLHQYSK